VNKLDRDGFKTLIFQIANGSEFFGLIIAVELQTARAEGSFQFENSIFKE
jgi:hypothetical protein